MAIAGRVLLFVVGVFAVAGTIGSAVRTVILPQLWPVLTGWDGDDPWHFLLTASGRDPGWPQVLE